MPLPEFSGELGIKRAAHLLRRATFGATKKQIEQVAALSASQAVDMLFSGNLPDPEPPLDLKTGQPWVLTGPTSANSEEFRLGQYFIGWHVAQMIGNNIPGDVALAHSTREKIVFFLHTHFTTIKSKVQSSRALYFQNVLFRKFAFDSSSPLTNFKQLTVKISIDNAMLRLLDGNLNVKGSPNENYARELLELYSIGRGLEGTLPEGLPEEDYFVYTEEDVRAAARVLSGWDFDPDFSLIDPETNLPHGKIKGSVLNAASHDNTVKTFSHRFDNQTIQPNPALLNGGNATFESALDEIRQLVDLLYSRDLTLKNICWKIYRFFVRSPHDKLVTGNDVAFIDANIIPAMVDTFRSSGYKIQPVIEELLKSNHFFDSGNDSLHDDNYGSLIKSPLDLAIGTIRAFNLSVPDMHNNLQDFYDFVLHVVSLVEVQGMKLYEPFDVAGYEAYHQFPIYNRVWITPNALAQRYEMIRNIFNAANPSMLTVDVLQYVSDNFPSTAGNARELIMAVATMFLPVTDNLSFEVNNSNSALSARRLNYFKERFLQQFDEAYWTERWNEGAGDLRDQLEFLFNAMLQSPEYQLF